MIQHAQAAGRAAMMALLQDRATITHVPLVFSGGTQHPGTPEITSGVACAIDRTLGQAAELAADQNSVINPAIIRMPLGTAIEPDDTIEIGELRFTARVILTQTNQLTLRVLSQEVIG